ncbi:MAG: hypothetical protein N2652_00510 [Kiritimatiellae bacterium]|nr:hypothetical protein [Kiritimatiellia bacterium]
MIVVRLEGRDVWWNLAAEEWLLEQAATDGPLLVFYVDDPAVVIGRHQNPWAETDPAALERGGVHLARRTSGGGAVWHDPGVLCFSFLMRRNQYRPATLFELTRRALARLGVVTRLENRTSLFAGECKVAGTAFRLRGDVAMHHGTLLVSADLDRLRTTLTPSCTIRRSSAIASVRAPVANLASLHAGLTVERCMAAISAEAECEWGPADQAWTDGDLDQDAIRRRADQHRSWDWRFGETPPFVAEISAGDLVDSSHWQVEVRDGRVAALVPPDRNTADADRILRWMGRPFDPSELAATLRIRFTTWPETPE